MSFVRNRVRGHLTDNRDARVSNVASLTRLAPNQHVLFCDHVERCPSKRDFVTYSNICFTPGPTPFKGLNDQAVSIKADVSNWQEITEWVPSIAP